MWFEEFQDKNGITKYRFIEKYKDPLTDKWKRTSVVMNKCTKPSQKEAERLLQAKIEAVLNDKTPTQLKSLTFHQALDEWLNHYKTTSGSKRTTIKAKNSNINAIKRDFDKDTLVIKLRLPHIQEVINKWHDDGVSSKHIRALVSCIRATFKHIKAFYNYDDISFINDITVPVRVKTREEIQKKRNKYLEDHELKELLECFDYKIDSLVHKDRKRNYTMIKNIVWFLANNGMRVGECLAIQVEDIDLEKKTLNINGSIIWERDNKTGAFGVKDTTKNESSQRTISLTTKSCDLLRKIMLDNKKMAMWDSKFIDRSFVFTNTSGSPMDLPKINIVLKEIVELTSFKDKHKDLTTHYMRHTHISKLSQLGISLKAIMERVGHTDHKTTLQIYSHVTEQMDKDMMSKLEAVSY